LAVVEQSALSIQQSAQLKPGEQLAISNWQLAQLKSADAEPAKGEGLKN